MSAAAGATLGRHHLVTLVKHSSSAQTSREGGEPSGRKLQAATPAKPAERSAISLDPLSSARHVVTGILWRSPAVVGGLRAAHLLFSCVFLPRPPFLFPARSAVQPVLFVLLLSRSGVPDLSDDEMQN